ncbi:hypothetical protein [Ancylomarina longa]|uniref:PAS domain-containing protein n=1 Tax=Ancylomarina longa TaxID=2487017 RepID=A0A434AX87_9BACT|nr:hypothetical protein [Ancylomarina longa]RUT79139.1 hypothetical protein DLK05_04800 [Ancylomarina longa]
MKNNLTLARDSFDFIKNSKDFLSIVLDNIPCAVFLLDKDFRLVALNDAFKTIFSNKKDENLLYRRCGEAIGCAHQIEEQKQCGDTTKCRNCELRIAALSSYADNKEIYNEHVVRPFYNFKNHKIDKELQFSTRLFHYNTEKYIIVILESNE